MRSHSMIKNSKKFLDVQHFINRSKLQNYRYTMCTGISQLKKLDRFIKEEESQNSMSIV